MFLKIGMKNGASYQTTTSKSFINYLAGSYVIDRMTKDFSNPAV